MTSKAATSYRAFAPAALALGCVIAATAPAAAQAPPKTPPTATTPAPTNCPPHARVTPPGTGEGTSGQSQMPLGDKLAKSEGVLCPPSNIDPEIRAPTPDVGKMPVIPPPGSPGGDQSVQPK
ncbi:hypothetical protein [Rhodopseudomonas sp. B29]|uniref:hypothetical protein n=1 Tax=Rhodopseudomonas sp. B29 TaxID=95607 RepID=UPI00034C7398|nr:hypothetical protein [Rhodopseudomonas sp. B29]